MGYTRLQRRCTGSCWGSDRELVSTGVENIRFVWLACRRALKLKISSGRAATEIERCIVTVTLSSNHDRKLPGLLYRSEQTSSRVTSQGIAGGSLGRVYPPCRSHTGASHSRATVSFSLRLCCNSRDSGTVVTAGRWRCLCTGHAIVWAVLPW